jgi:hypothetical protein
MNQEEKQLPSVRLTKRTVQNSTPFKLLGVVDSYDPIHLGERIKRNNCIENEMSKNEIIMDCHQSGGWLQNLFI